MTINNNNLRVLYLQIWRHKNVIEILSHLYLYLLWIIVLCMD